MQKIDGTKYVIILPYSDNKNVLKLLKKLSKHCKINYIYAVVEVKDPRVLGGFVSQYNLRILRSFTLYPI